jgi:hypothetical protein
MNALKEINDSKLIEVVHVNIYSNDRSQDELERIMNLIRNNYAEQQ